MKDLDYVKESMSQEGALRFHLTTNFYPPLPDFVKDAFVEVFKEYWAGDLDVSDLDKELAERAYYTGGIDNYDFWQFCKEEDLEAHPY
jgi:hypothetical protein